MAAQCIKGHHPARIVFYCHMPIMTARSLIVYGADNLKA